jgi:hypothetical protein
LMGTAAAIHVMATSAEAPSCLLTTYNQGHNNNADQLCCKPAALAQQPSSQIW